MMSDFERILHAIDFIETHLEEDIQVGDIAASVSVSVFHFSRLFNTYTRLTPYNYLIRRRLTQAALTILDSNMKIIDIAYDFQFAAPETFSRIFKKIYRLTPSEVRKLGRLDERLLLPPFSGDYIDFIKTGIPKPDFEFREDIKLMGFSKKLKFPNEASVHTVPGLIFSETEAIIIEKPDLYEFRMPYFGNTNNHPFAMTAFRVNDFHSTPLSLLTKDLPGGKMVSFMLQGDSDHYCFLREFIAHTWWPKVFPGKPMPLYELISYPDGLEGIKPSGSVKLSLPVPGDLS